MSCTIIYIDYEKFVNSLGKASDKLRAKVIATLMTVEADGLDRVDVKSLQNNIFELRIQQSNNIFRILFFYDSKQRKYIVVTNGFVKKTQKTPVRELNKAQKLYKEYKNKEDEI